MSGGSGGGGGGSGGGSHGGGSHGGSGNSHGSHGSCARASGCSGAQAIPTTGGTSSAVPTTAVAPGVNAETDALLSATSQTAQTALLANALGGGTTGGTFGGAKHKQQIADSQNQARLLSAAHQDRAQQPSSCPNFGSRK